MPAGTPDVIARYFTTVAEGDDDAFVATFAENGVVVDESETYSGRDAIRAWREQTRSAYRYTAELLHIEGSDDAGYVATVRLEGSFPGSPIELDYRFTVSGGSIVRLDIN